MDVEEVSCPDCNGDKSYWNTESQDHIPNSRFWEDILCEHGRYLVATDDDEHIDPCDYCYGKGVIDEPKEDTAYANGECNWS
jgi:hypothetical protein